MKHLEEAPLKGKKLLLEMLYSYDYFQFSSIFIKNKIRKLNFLKKKTGSNQFGSVFQSGSVFSGLARFFRFDLVFSVSSL
jgi:hypothetical protein